MSAPRKYVINIKLLHIPMAYTYDNEIPPFRNVMIKNTGHEMITNECNRSNIIEAQCGGNVHGSGRRL